MSSSVMMFLAVVLVVCLPYLSQGYPAKCRENTFFDLVKQKFLPCSDCKEKNKDICYECCPKIEQDSDALYVSEPITTAPVPSAMYKTADTYNRKVVGMFFHIFIIVMVVSTLSVIICVGLKVVKERQREECVSNNGRHSDNQDVAIIQEVLALPQPGSFPKSLTSVSLPDNHVPEAISKQGVFDKALL